MKTSKLMQAKKRYGLRSIALSFVLSLGGVGLIIVGASTLQNSPDFIHQSSTENHSVAASSTTTPIALSYSEPAYIRIPSLTVESPVMQVGTNNDNTMEVPTGDDIDKAAWYQNSSSPGQIGSSVIVGHVINDTGAPSIFYELGTLAVGENIVIEREDGSVAEFEVVKREIHPRDEFPDDLVYSNQGEPTLRILTCGGSFDTESNQYSDNVIISANLTSVTPKNSDNIFVDQFDAGASRTKTSAIIRNIN